jgi:hypothetical protein
MRQYRMGLIQTADQLRFSYLAIIEGAKCLFQENGNIMVRFTHILILLRMWEGIIIINNGNIVIIINCNYYYEIFTWLLLTV